MSSSKRYQKMNLRQLQDATKEFDEPFVIDRSRPLTPEERQRWRRVRRKRGRPKTGEGYRRISVSIEGGLLKKVTTLAKKRRVSRSQLFAQVLAEALAQE